MKNLILTTDIKKIIKQIDELDENNLIGNDVFFINGILSDICITTYPSENQKFIDIKILAQTDEENKFCNYIMKLQMKMKLYNDAWYKINDKIYFFIEKKIIKLKKLNYEKDN